ncbi:MAG: permease [Flavobacteriales bacterium]|nr:permease [Flavobacteriales bacterium]
MNIYLYISCKSIKENKLIYNTSKKYILKRLHLFLFKSFIGPFITSFFVAIFLLLMQFLWKYIDDLVGKGLDIYQISQLLFYASTRFVPIALPIAALLSSLLLFGKLGENYELIALKASGISFTRIIFPLSILIIFISCFSFLFSNYIMPIANLKNGSMIYDIQRKKPALNIKEGIFYNDIEGYSIKIGQKEKDGINFNDILIYDYTSKNKYETVITANYGKMKLTKDENFLEIELYDGYSYIEIKEGKKVNEFRRTKFKKDIIRLDISNFKFMGNSEKLYRGHYAMLNNYQLNFAIDSLQKKLIDKKNSFYNNFKKNFNSSVVIDSSIQSHNFKNLDNDKEHKILINKISSLKSLSKRYKDEIEYRKKIITKHKIEWHRKISLAVACFILFIIGSSIGSIVRKGGFGIPVLVSIFFFLTYHVLSIIGEKSAKELNIEAYQGIWLANFIFFPIAIILFYLAKNDMKIFNISNIKVRIFTK